MGTAKLRSPTFRLGHTMIDTDAPRWCLTCGKPLIRRPGDNPAKFAQRVTCGGSCWRQLVAERRKKHLPPKSCKACGTQFTQRPDEALGNYKHRKTCSPACAASITARNRPPIMCGPQLPPHPSPYPGGIGLQNGMVAHVDLADFERVNVHRWRAYKSRNVWYADTSIAGRSVTMHRFILSPPDGMDVDHKDRDGLNNRRGNLRIATTAQNVANQRLSPNNTSGYRGVHRHKSQRWVAAITCNRKATHIGYFAKAEDAARAYDTKARELFGEFARLNFPEEGEQAV
jgi:hypothetical protein